MRQNQFWQAIDSLRPEEWFGGESDRIGRSAVYEQIILPARRVKIDRHTPVDGKDMEPGRRRIPPAEARPEKNEEGGGCNFPNTHFRPEEPASYHSQQQRVIQESGEQVRCRDIKVGP